MNTDSRLAQLAIQCSSPALKGAVPTDQELIDYRSHKLSDQRYKEVESYLAHDSTSLHRLINLSQQKTTFSNNSQNPIKNMVAWIREQSLAITAVTVPMVTAFAFLMMNHQNVNPGDKSAYNSLVQQKQIQIHNRPKYEQQNSQTQSSQPDFIPGNTSFDGTGVMSFDSEPSCINSREKQANCTDFKSENRNSSSHTLSN